MTTKQQQQTLDKPSKQVEEVSNWWRKCKTASAGHSSLAEMREFNEAWGALTTEPRGVDYIETDAGGVLAMWAIPKKCEEDRVILYLHGGGFISGSMYTHRKLAGHFAKNIGCRSLIIDYRYTPEFTYPTQINETLASYKWLLEQGIQAKHIVIAGDSAGGGLSVGASLLIRDRGLPMPAAIIAISPWFDMASTGESLDYNEGKDDLFHKQWIKDMADMYIGSEGNSKDPYASPLYANLTGLSPIYIHVGGNELLLDDSVRFAALAKKAGIDASVDIFPAMQHSFQMAAGRAPEADDSISRLVEWVKPKLGLV